MCAVHFVGTVRFAFVKMDAEMSVEIVVLDGSCSVRHAVHGRGIHMAVIFDQNGSSSPAPVAIDGFHDLCIIGCQRLRVQMIVSAPAFAGEYLSGLDILHLEGCALRNLVFPVFEPVQTLRLEPAAVRRGG